MKSKDKKHKRLGLKLTILTSAICLSTAGVLFGVLLTPDSAQAFWVDRVGTPSDLEHTVVDNIIVDAWGTTSSVSGVITDIRNNDRVFQGTPINSIHDFTLRSTLYSFPLTMYKGDALVCVDANWNPVVFKIEGTVTITCIDDYINAITNPNIPMVKAYYGSNPQTSSDDRYFVASAPINSGGTNYLVHQNNVPLPVSNQDNFFQIPSDGVTYINQKYPEGAFVKYGSNYYRSNKQTTNIPTVTADWEAVGTYVPGQSLTGWNSSTTYAKHAVVAQNGLFWVSNTNNNRGNSPENWKQSKWSRVAKWVNMTENEPLDADNDDSWWNAGTWWTRYRNGVRFYNHCSIGGVFSPDRPGTGPTYHEIRLFSSGMSGSGSNRCYTLNENGDPLFWTRSGTGSTSEYPGTGSVWTRKYFEPTARYYYTFDKNGRMMIWENLNAFSSAPDAPNPYTWGSVNLDSGYSRYVIMHGAFYATDLITQKTGVWNLLEQAWIGGTSDGKMKYNWQGNNYYKVNDVVCYGISRTNNYRYFINKTAPTNYQNANVDPMSSPTTSLWNTTRF